MKMGKENNKIEQHKKARTNETSGLNKKKFVTRAFEGEEDEIHDWGDSFTLIRMWC